MSELAVDGAVLRYDAYGEGPPVVFVHGTGTYRDTFAPVLRALRSTGRLLVAYDRRGFGASTGAARRLPQHTEDLTALVRHLDSGPATIVSQSGGAVVALGLAASHPELVRDMVLAEPALHVALTPSWSSTRAMAALQFRRWVRRDPVGALVSYYRWSSSRRDGGNGYDPLPQDWKQTAIGHADAVFRELPQLMRPWPRRSALRAIHCPVTLALGDLGLPVFHRTTRRAQRLLPRTQLAHVTGTGHLIPTDQPEAFAAVVAAHLERTA